EMFCAHKCPGSIACLCVVDSWFRAEVALLFDMCHAVPPYYYYIVKATTCKPYSLQQRLGLFLQEGINSSLQKMLGVTGGEDPLSEDAGALLLFSLGIVAMQRIHHGRDTIGIVNYVGFHELGGHRAAELFATVVAQDDVAQQSGDVGMLLRNDALL